MFFSKQPSPTVTGGSLNVFHYFTFPICVCLNAGKLLLSAAFLLYLGNPSGYPVFLVNPGLSGGAENVFWSDLAKFSIYKFLFHFPLETKLSSE